MKGNENITMENFTKANPFTVPEGYFDTLTQRVMNSIDEQQQEVKVVELKPKAHRHWTMWASGIAACIAGTLICVNVLDKAGTNAQQAELINQQTTEECVTYDEQYQMDAMNYAMVDYNDVYSYLSGGEY
ncbi:MAG: hypothetical protein KBS99_08425 [Prevotellaceae bacterium]|nr:hypothetical protein [Candidatus Colivivens caballi]